MGVALAYNPCGWCPHKESGTRCGMCELTFRRKEWISVEDRLPEIEGKYLVFTNKGYIFACYYYKTNPFRFKHWDVTHWMPLPEAPKMKGEKI